MVEQRAMDLEEMSGRNGYGRNPAKDKSFYYSVESMIQEGNRYSGSLKQSC